MPRLVPPLTQQAIQGAKPRATRYELRDGKITGLILRIEPTGRKSWHLRLPDRRRFPLGLAEAVTLSAARERARVLIEHNGLPPAPGPTGDRDAGREPTVSDFLRGRYRPWFEAQHPDATQLHSNLTPFGTVLALPLSQVTRAAVDRWVTARLETVGKATVRRNVGQLKALLSKARDWGVLEINPLERYQPVKHADEARTRYLSPDEERRLRAALEGVNERLASLVLVALGTGARRKELFELRWNMVDFRAGVITLIAKTTKSKRTRHIPMSREVRCLLAALHWERPEANPYVFPGRTGQRYSNVDTAVQRVLRDAAIEDFSFHCLRHTFAAKLVQRGVSLYVVQRLLGHSDPKLTVRYSHLAPDTLRDAVALLDGGR